MKHILGLILLSISTCSFAGNVVLNGTRFIYPSDEKEISIQLTNNATTPALVQAWFDTGNPDALPEDITTPFSMTPPISKIEGKSGQTLRIRAINKSAIPNDRESLWWLNTLEVPPTPKASEREAMNILQMAIRSRFKFIYRPVGLGNPVKAPEQLIVKGEGNKIHITNPTPFYITIIGISKGNGPKINKTAVMVSPKSDLVAPLSSNVGKGENLTFTTLNDYGSNVGYKLTTN